MDQPLILTVQLDPPAQAFYDDLRRRYFPRERNVVPAHLTLFHQLPDEDAIYETLEQSARTTSTLLLANPALRSIGRGVTVFFESAFLNAFHVNLSAALAPHLIPQDRQRLKPHIVVQNKVSAETANQTLQQLKTTALIEPRAIGLTIWRYLGGPWQHLCDLPFDAPASSPMIL